MPRYFIQVAYRGTNYSGFQVQQNANSIQAEIEKALNTFFRSSFELTCSSRTDAGVHAYSNYFHFDSDCIPGGEQLDRSVYNLNAILPADIVIKRIVRVPVQSHARFDAVAREYEYLVYQLKNPFITDRAYYYPYTLNMDQLNAAAAVLMEYHDFSSFSKRNTQVKTFICDIYRSGWQRRDDCIVYTVRGNRFLRGMVRGLVGTMLKVGKGKMGIEEFKKVIEGRDSSRADFSVPAHGLFLKDVFYPEILPGNL